MNFELLKNEPMSKHTTFKTGGCADAFYRVFNIDGLREVLEIISAKGEKPLIIGNGSNLLVSDMGPGVPVIEIGEGMSEVSVDGDTIVALAGARLSKVSRCAMENSLTGMEFASGIPGTIGGALYMNAGAYGGEMADVIESVRVLTLQGEQKTMPASELKFRYRFSALQEEPLIVTQAVCVLKPGNRDEITACMETLQQKRMEKQPLQYPSAGSTFKRPEGAFAAKLIDDCGLRGTWVGGAQVSEKHAGFLLNRGGTAADFVALMDLVRERVRKETGFVLEPEVRILGTA